MNLRQIAVAALAALTLSACGGGGGGGGGGAASVAPTYALTPATLRASVVAGYPSTVNFSAKQSVTFIGVTYVKVVPDADVIDPNIIFSGDPGGTFNVEVKTAAALPPGHYSGNITINVCADANCNSQLAGSPFKLPYDIDVTPADGAVFAYNQSALSALPGATDWETFQGNAQHTGYVPVSLNPALFNPRWKWFAPSNAGTPMRPSTIATGGGRFYVSTGSEFDGARVAITAYNESDGSKVWSHSFLDLAYPSTNPPALSGGRVFVSAGSQSSTAMFAFDAASGLQLFRTPMTSQWEHYLAPTVFNGTVFNDGGSYGGLYSFSAATGVQNFYASLPQYDGWTPAIDAQNLYAYLEGKLHIVDPGTGAVRVTIADPTYSWNGYTVAGAPVIGAGGVVFAGNLSNQADNAIVAFDTSTQSVRWTSKGAYSGNPAYVDGLLFAANSASGMLEARKESDGTLVWSWVAPSGDQHFVSDVLVTKNLVFLSTDNATYAVDRASHAAVWNYQAGGKLALSANGVLYIKGASTIVAINLR
jgi:outer membrane protein assembly factor BamB